MYLAPRDPLGSTNEINVSNNVTIFQASNLHSEELFTK